MAKYRKLLIVSLLALGVTVIGPVGCNTTAGFGQDLEAAGDAIQNKADTEKGY